MLQCSSSLSHISGNSISGPYANSIREYRCRPVSCHVVACSMM